MGKPKVEGAGLPAVETGRPTPVATTRPTTADIAQATPMGAPNTGWVPGQPMPTPLNAPSPLDDPNDWRKKWRDMFANQGQIGQAVNQLLPAYQARTSGIMGPTEQAMRLKGQQAIQSQYGNALRSAMSQGAAQGMRGAAAQALQQDVRNQMGQAEANLSRDLIIADWDAKRQALADLGGFATSERAGILGTQAGIEQLANTNRGFDQSSSILKGMGQNQDPGFLYRLANPQMMFGLPEAPGSSSINSFFRR